MSPGPHHTHVTCVSVDDVERCGVRVEGHLQREAHRSHAMIIHSAQQNSGIVKQK